MTTLVRRSIGPTLGLLAQVKGRLSLDSNSLAELGSLSCIPSRLRAYLDIEAAVRIRLYAAEHLAIFDWAVPRPIAAAEKGTHPMTTLATFSGAKLCQALSKQRNLTTPSYDSDSICSPPFTDVD